MPFVNVNTSMKKIVHLWVQTIKNLFGKEKNCGKLLPLLERHLVKWINMQNQICSNGIGNDNISQSVDVINQ
jgi:hypothetical protein